MFSIPWRKTSQGLNLAEFPLTRHEHQKKVPMAGSGQIHVPHHNDIFASIFHLEFLRDFGISNDSESFRCSVLIYEIQ